MSEIKFSNKLSDKLGEERVNEVNELSSLVDFKSFLVDMMDANNCNDVIRESVLSKMERLTEVLVKITQINNDKFISKTHIALGLIRSLT